MDWYFSKFEDRKPYDPIPYSAKREFLYQYLATINIGIGLWYFWWRWTASLNPDAMFISILLALAETSAFIGTVLFIINLWAYKDAPQQSPPQFIDECLPLEERTNGRRPVSVDVFLPTYTEDPELVRLSIIDAKKMTYPYPLDLIRRNKNIP